MLHPKLLRKPSSNCIMQFSQRHNSQFARPAAPVLCSTEFLNSSLFSVWWLLITSRTLTAPTTQHNGKEWPCKYELCAWLHQRYVFCIWHFIHLILLYFCTYIFGILKIHLIHCCIIGKTAVSSVFVLKLFTDTCIILYQVPKIIKRTIIFNICEIFLTCIFDHCMYFIIL